MVLFLVGYMGSGKSVIGKTLAEILDFQYVDFDDYIELKEQTSIQAIFENKGEIYFRKTEHNYLEDMFKLNNTVVSLGGGTPCYGNNMSRILQDKHSKSIYLKTSVTTLFERLFDERDKRPLISHINSKEELMEFIGKHIFERAPYYEQCQVTVHTDNKPVKIIAEDIVLQLF